jgi:hypothetical protein
MNRKEKSERDRAEAYRLGYRNGRADRACGMALPVALMPWNGKQNPAYSQGYADGSKGREARL